jgi:hypothetical protein
MGACVCVRARYICHVPAGALGTYGRSGTQPHMIHACARRRMRARVRANTVPGNSHLW